MDKRKYSKLRGLIVSNSYLLSEIAELIGCTLTTLSLKLNGKAKWTTKDIERLSEILSIPQNEVGSYFF